MRKAQEERLQEKTLYGYYGNSLEQKPTDDDLSTDRADDLASGSWFFEVDTGDMYMYEESAATWYKVGGDNA